MRGRGADVDADPARTGADEDVDTLAGDNMDMKFTSSVRSIMGPGTGLHVLN